MTGRQSTLNYGHPVEASDSAAEHYPPGFCPSEELAAYVQLLHGCCRSYVEDLDFDKLMVSAWKKLNARTINEISMGVFLGIPEDMIEWGMRFCTGSGGANKDVEMALELWKHVTDPSPLHPPLRRPPSRRVLAMAHCLQANVYRERAFIGEETLQIDDMIRAAKAADASAALGLVAPIVLLIAKFLDGPFGPRGDASLRELPQLSRLDSMWDAWERRLEEVERERLTRSRKVARAPNAYCCAAEGCGIEGTKKAILLRCGGRCEGAHKPHYCSKECQRKDWKRHKSMCKPGCPYQGDQTVDNTTVEGDSTNPSVGHGEGSGATQRDPWDEELLPRESGRERIIKVPAPGRPGHFIEIASSTMTPGMLRDFKEKMEEYCASKSD